MEEGTKQLTIVCIILLLIVGSVGAIIYSILSYLNLKLIDWNVIKTAFDCTKDNCNLIPSNLINIYSIIGEYILISLAIISFVAMFKRGYSNLKSYNDKGLIGGLIVGLIIGLIGGLIGGLIIGLIGGLIVGLIIGLIDGLIGGLIIGLIVGLTEEFK